MVAISQTPLESHWVIVLCGGRGSRLGSVTESIPKSLALIHDKPIIWYTFLTLVFFISRGVIDSFSS